MVLSRAVRLATIVILAALTHIAACGAPKTEGGGLTPREGYVTVPGGKVWYRIVGSGTATPLLLLHGGPGVPSQYLKPLLALADERPVIIYDQLGTGKSDHPTDTSLWKTERFVQELAALRDSLGLREVHLYGHSWGTMLAADYLLTKPVGVRSVTFASPCLSAILWKKDADSLITLLPDSVRRVITTNEAAGTTSSPAYQAAINEYYSRYVFRTTPLSADADSSFAGIAQTVYGTMWGPSEFAPTGNLKTYDRTPRLGEITIPALFTAGEFDEATPATTQYYSTLVPGARFEMIPGAAHMVMLDNPDQTIKVLRNFLHSVESR